MTRGIVVLLCCCIVAVRVAYAAFTIFQAAQVVNSDPTVGIIPSYNDAYANWTKAGLQTLGGISAVNAGRTNCTSGQAGLTMPLAPSGITPPAGGDDAARINQAITNCPANTIIQLTSGVFNIDVTEGILITKSNITLRGGTCTGSTPGAYCQTQIIRPNGLLPYQMGQTPGQCGTSYSNLNSCSTVPLIMVSNAGQFGVVWGGCQFPAHVEVGDCASTRYATVAADVVQGATTVQVDSTTPFSVGLQVLINENTQAVFQTDPVPHNTGGQVYSSPDAFSSSGSPASGRTSYLYYNPHCCNDAPTADAAKQESSTYSLFFDRPYGEIHQVSAIGAGPCPGVNCTITFDSPIMITFRQSNSHDAKVFVPTANSGPTFSILPLVQKVGVENMTLGRGNEGNVYLSYCAYCWVQNVESYGWTNGAVEVVSGFRVELNNVYGYDCYSSTNSGAEYVFDFKGGSTEYMLTNSISRTGGKNMTSRGAGGGGVVSYNYFDDPWYDTASTISNTWIDMSLNSTHFPGTHHTLFEGNQGVNMDGDDTHGGGANYHVFFGNHSMGYRTPFVDPEGNSVNDFTNGATAPLRTTGPGPYNYWYAFVGNVLGGTLNNAVGAAPYATVANGWSYIATYSGATKAVHMNGSDNSDVDIHLNYNSPPYYALHDGNYDYVNNAVVWNAGSHALPNSLYLTSAPSFFSGGVSCTYPWPWVTPTGGSQLLAASGPGACTTYWGLPARARYQAGTPLSTP